MTEELQIRAHGPANAPVLIYLPGLHGNWKLVGAFRRALADRVRFIEVSYPHTITWSLASHAEALEKAFATQEVDSGWVLSESFSSQVAWALLERKVFQVEGLVLAGGFVRHPLGWAARLAQKFCDQTSFRVLQWILFGYARVCRFRFRHSPETFAEIREFVLNLTPRELDAARHRLHLIAENDPRQIARQAAVPIYALTGLFDPVVPWMPVRRWLKRNCPALRAYRVIWRADHNVLGTACQTAAAQIVEWIRVTEQCRVAAAA